MVAAFMKTRLQALSERIDALSQVRDESLVAYQAVSPEDERGFVAAKGDYMKANSDLTAALSLFHRAWKRDIQ